MLETYSLYVICRPDDDERGGDPRAGHDLLRGERPGDGPTVVFVHGAFVDGTSWRKVTPRLADRFRCVVPDLPLGAHRTPMSPGADLLPRASRG